MASSAHSGDGLWSLSSAGFPPIPGHKSTGAEQGFIAALETADKLTSTGAVNEAANEDEEEEREEEVAVRTTSDRLLLFKVWF